MQQDNRLKILIYLAVFLTAGLVILGVVLSRSEDGGAGYPDIEISPAEYNAGTVSMADGLVERTYKIKNSGDADLKINGIWTSCMCTTAVLKTGDKASPEFGMHDSPTFWSQEIAPGGEGDLEVIFDPAFHGPGGTGEVIREIYILSNDPDSKQVKVRLIANVTS